MMMAQQPGYRGQMIHHGERAIITQQGIENTPLAIALLCFLYIPLDLIGRPWLDT